MVGGKGGGSFLSEVGTSSFLRLIDHFEKSLHRGDRGYIEHVRGFSTPLDRSSTGLFPLSGATVFGKPMLYVSLYITVAESPVTPHSLRTNLPGTSKFGYIVRAAIEDAADFCGVEYVFASFHRVAVLMDGLGPGFRWV
jgi:hypothetical protein